LIKNWTVSVNAASGAGEPPQPVLGIYPNPSEDIIFVTIPEHGQFYLRLYAISGKILLERTIPEEASIDTRHLPAGVYFLTATNGVSRYHGKLIKR